MPQDPHATATQAAIDALQEAVLVTGAVRRAALTGLDDLGKLKLALDRAIAALRRGAGHAC